MSEQAGAAVPQRIRHRISHSAAGLIDCARTRAEPDHDQQRRR